MNIILYGNCQFEAIKIILKKVLNNKYNIDYISNYKCIIENKPINIDVINKYNIFIYQPIKDDKGLHSTKYILENIKKNIICISIPYIYNTGMWCLVLNNNNLINGFNNSYTYFNENTRVSGMEYLKEKNIKLLYNKFINNELFFNLKKRFIESLYKLKNIEKKTDIIISDYIENNYKNIQMFYRDCHPSLEVIKEIVKRILKFLNILENNIINNINNIYDLNEFKMLTKGYIPITKYERQELNLNFEINNYFENENNNWKIYYKNLLDNII